MATRPKRKVCVLGSGNLGTAMAKIVAENARVSAQLDEAVTLYVYEELVDGRRLSELINETRENVKYLPGCRLPDNVRAEPDLVRAAAAADLLVLAVPPAKVRAVCDSLRRQVKPTAAVVSLVRGLNEDGELASRVIRRVLRTRVAVFMGAGTPRELADGKFSECTVGCRDRRLESTLRHLFSTPYLKVSVVYDPDAVEVCGALRGVVACAAGVVDGLGLGVGARTAVVRASLLETVRFLDVFHPGSRLSTFFQACGLGASIAASFAPSRHARLAAAVARTRRPLAELEEELLGGQALLAAATVRQVVRAVEDLRMLDDFPVFAALYGVLQGELEPEAVLHAVMALPDLVPLCRHLSVLSMKEELRRALDVSSISSFEIPELVGVTEIFTEEHRKKLSRHLPARAEGYLWTLVFSTSQHGFSLNSMYRKMSKVESPILMVIEDTEHNVFGALTSCALKVSDHFYGTGESLLFRFTPEFQVFPWTGKNMYFMKGNNESLAIGAGDGKFGLWLDGDLYQGRTQPCSTYGNEPLAPQEDFVVKTLECWAFI